MEATNWNTTLIYRYFAVVLLLLPAVALPGSASAQGDSFYIDSVQAAPGQDIPVRFFMSNSEPLSSLSLPISYDPALLTLKSVSFSDSRGEYIANKLVTPADAGDVNGHFLVGFMVLFEDALPVGDGLLFTALFNVSESATAGTASIIDSLFYPPGGEVLFVEADSSHLIYPEFSAGKVVVTSVVNQPPTIASIPDQSIFEGDNLTLNISAGDPNNDPIVLVCTDKPLGATFVDNGDGTAVFGWQSDYIGPNSADGSPFSIRLWASDGDLSADTEIPVNVVNLNRKPVIVADDLIEAESGGELNLTVSAYDPDFEPVTWEVINLPSGATFDYENPGELYWSTALVDTGSYDLTLIASDPQGYADTAAMVIHLQPTSIYSLTLDTTSAFPGELVACNITLDNKSPIGSFNLLYHYDPSVLTLLDVSSMDTRADEFEYYNVSLDDNQTPGLVRIIGIADNGGGTSLLGSGDGLVANILYRVSSNISFSGMNVPVRFQFLDAGLDDNTMTDTLGVRIEQEAIDHEDGYVNVLSLGEVKIGDINLNYIAYEIGDAIYLTNHFMNPSLYPLNPLQYANSDVNHDGAGATIGDLVTLINVIVNGASAPRTSAEALTPADVYCQTTGDRTEIVCRADFELGGLLLNVESGDEIALEKIENQSDRMTVDASLDGNILRLLIYSFEGACVQPGETSLIGIGGLADATIISASVADIDGRMVEVSLGRTAGAVPESFKLHQNYPNPFNPDTRIDFDLPQSSRVALAVFNVLGRKVKTLINEQMPAGTHTVVWDGREDNGNPVASGVYLYRLETGSSVFTRKMMLLK